MLADFDRMIVGQKAGLECKTVSPYSADKWSDGQIPLHYQMQVQHYLAVSGFECWYIAAVVFGRDFIIHKIERDEELVELIEKLETEKNTIDQKIKLEMQDASKALAEEYQVTWSSYSSSRLDSKRLKAEKPEIYEAYVNKSSARRFTVNRVA